MRKYVIAKLINYLLCLHAAWLLYFSLIFKVFQVQIMFYSPPAKGIKIERSIDGGKTYTPWQYYAEDCTRMFGLVNNGALTQADSVNCLQIIRYILTTETQHLFSLSTINLSLQRTLVEFIFYNHILGSSHF